MTATDHRALMNLWSEVITSREWDRFAELVQPDAVLEYPQSGERFRGIANIRATFAEYPELGAGSTQVDEVIGSPTAYALTPSYTLIAIDGSGDTWGRGQPRPLPGRHMWYALLLYELRDGLLERIRAYFAPDFDPPDWREAVPRGAVGLAFVATDELSRAAPTIPAWISSLTSSA